MGSFETLLNFFNFKKFLSFFLFWKHFFFLKDSFERERVSARVCWGKGRERENLKRILR